MYKDRGFCIPPVLSTSRCLQLPRAEDQAPRKMEFSWPWVYMFGIGLLEPV